MKTSKYSLKVISDKLNDILNFINSKYYEVEDFSLCIMLSLISKTHMIALGQPGIAKSAILREIVDIIDFDGIKGTPYFQVQMGADISPNNILGSPDIEYYKKYGVIKRNYKGFLPDAIISYCSEFYRINDQVANSGILTILNEGEFKNGTDILKTRLRFLMADTNFFPKQLDDLESDERDLRLQALHDRFLSRVLVSPIKDKNNKIKMILMDDTFKSDISLHLNELIYMQELLDEVELPEYIALHMVNISETLQNKNNIFISPRRLKNSRNLIKAHALLNGRVKCNISDLISLRFTFWQNEEDINVLNDIIFDTLNLPLTDSKKYRTIYYSIKDEINSKFKNTSSLPTFEPDKIYFQGINDLNNLLNKILDRYNTVTEYEHIIKIYVEIENELNDLIIKRNNLNNKI